MNRRKTGAVQLADLKPKGLKSNQLPDFSTQERLVSRRNVLESEEIGSYLMIGSEYSEASSNRNKKEKKEREKGMRKLQRSERIDVNFDLSKLKVNSFFFFLFLLNLIKNY